MNMSLYVEGDYQNIENQNGIIYQPASFLSAANRDLLPPISDG